MLARLRRTFFVVHTSSLLLLSLAACGDTGAPIRIGLAGPFSDPVGAPMKRAAELAVEEINAAGGVRGRPLELVTRDDFGDPDSAVAVASALEAAKVVAVIGHVYSGTTLAAAPVYNGAEHSGGPDIAFVLVARGNPRRRLHLPGLPQRHGPWRRAGPLRPRPAWV